MRGSQEAKFASYDDAFVKAKQPRLTLIDAVQSHKIDGKLNPKAFFRDGTPCPSDCLAKYELRTARIGPVPLPWGSGLGGALLLLGIVYAWLGFRDNPRRNLINHQRNRIALKTRGDTLPIIRQGSSEWGIMRRLKMRGTGRREFGNGIFLGAPGKGKGNLLKVWLLSSDALNFVVVDLKGDLWNETAGHRATLGKVIRLNLSSLDGDGYDPFDTDQKADVIGLFEILLPTDEPRTAHFNMAAQQIAAAYWNAARQTGQSTVSVLVQAATSATKDMVLLARRLVDDAPAHCQAQVLSDFQGAFAEVWDDPNKASGGERGSVLSSFRAAFAGLNTPEILSTLAVSTFDPAELVKGGATLYITAPSTQAPYRAPLEMLLGAVVDEIFAYCDEYGAGEEIVILADEAGELKIPRFNNILSSGRSRNVTLTAFLQDLGQLKQYHPDGWRGITDTIHHWTFWNTKNPQAREFLKDVCGGYDKRNPTRDPDERKRRPHIDQSAFEEMVQQWPQDRVLSVLDYDRVHVVYGEAVTPFRRRLAARRKLPAPKLSRLYVPTYVPLGALPTAKPATLAEKAPTMTMPALDGQDDEDETF